MLLNQLLTLPVLATQCIVVENSNTVWVRSTENNFYIDSEFLGNVDEMLLIIVSESWTNDRLTVCQNNKTTIFLGT